MVADVIDPIKERYRFIDLLKPETEAVIPLLLALEPGVRKLLSKAIKHSIQANQHRMQSAAMPAYGGDIHSDIAAGTNDFGSDIRSFAEPASQTKVVVSDEAALLDSLNDVLDGGSTAFLQSIDGTDASASNVAMSGIGDDISTADTISRSWGLAKLLLSRNDRDVARRLPALLMAMRCLQNNNSFVTDVEHLTEYRDAADGLTNDGIRCVVFGHTHDPRHVRLPSGGTYFNSGTWADVFRFPNEIVSGADEIALPKLREFVQRMSVGDFLAWSLFRPTFVRLGFDQSDRLVESELCEYSGPNSV